MGRDFKEGVQAGNIRIRSCVYGWSLLKTYTTFLGPLKREDAEGKKEDLRLRDRNMSESEEEKPEK